MTDWKEYLDQTAEQIDLMLQRYLGEINTELYKASAHLLLAGGKRLRPAVLFLAADAVKPGQNDDLIPAALALEMTHTFTLIHDDIMDGDATRRGVPTVHTVWDEPTAILAGDVLYAKAFEYITFVRAPDTAKVRAVSLLAHTCAEICEGQHEDMTFERTKDVTVEEYIDMASKKTGALYGAAAAIGGLLAGGDPIQVDALYRYGLNAGIAFQIQDDLIDLVAQPEVSGKDRGSDLREGKQTLIAIIAREKCIDLGCYRRDLTDAEMDEAIRTLEEADVIEEVRAIAIERAGRAKSALALLPASTATEYLGDIVDFFINRSC